MKLHAITLAAGLMMVGSASAVTLSNVYTGPITGDINTSSFGAGETYVDSFSVGSIGAIVHRLEFNINTNLYAGSGVFNNPVNLSYGSFTINALDINDLNAEIFDSNDVSYATFVQLGTNPGVLTLPSNSYFAMGDYTLKVTGTATGSMGGAYTIVAVTAPVPESETYAMLLVGLGLVGLRLRQKNNIAKQALSA